MELNEKSLSDATIQTCGAVCAKDPKCVRFLVTIYKNCYTDSIGGTEEPTNNSFHHNYHRLN